MKAIIGGKEYEITIPADGLPVLVNGKEINVDWYSPAKGFYHFLYNSKSYNGEIVELDEKSRTAIVSVNNKRMEVVLKDESDELLEKLGISSSVQKQGTIKAPMPGLVLQVLVKEGDKVSKNDGLIVLEAMKMENLLKPSFEGIIKAVHVSQGMKVEKNQVLLEVTPRPPAPQGG